MDRKRRIAVFLAALTGAVATIVTIGLSVEAIRDSVQFGRIMQRVEQGDTTTSTLMQAAEFARTTRDWQTLMRIAWNLDDHRKWNAVAALSKPAMRRFPKEDRWRYAGALAALRLKNRPQARDLLRVDRDSPADDVGQFLRILAELDPTDQELSRERLKLFSELPPEYTVLRAVAMAETSSSLKALRTAWEVTAVGAYGVNAALEAAAIGDREAARLLITHVRDANVLPPAERESAPLYLAVWLRDIDWLFEQLHSLSGIRAVEPELLLIHADGLVQQGRLREARRFYRELQQVAADYDPIAFLNDAAITYQLRDGDPERILREGVRVHRDSAILRSELAGVLVAQDKRIAAAQILGPSLVTLPAGTQHHRDWLLTRAVLGPRRPISRLESDLWLYLNEHPNADLVAQYLARFLATRGDEAGADRLRARYGPEHSEWSTTLHLQQARKTAEFSRAETLLNSYPDDSWTAQYNRTLFALYHLPLTEVEAAIAEFEGWLDRGPELSRETYSQAELWTLLTRVEYERLAGRTETAFETLQQAMRRAPDNLNLSSYEVLLHPPNESATIPQ